MRNQAFYLLLLPVFFAVQSCSSEEDIPGSPPVADAGDDIEISIDQAGTILLNGSASSDPDGDMLTYRWTLREQPSASTATLNNENEANASLTPDAEGLYIAILEVDDGNHPPVQDEKNITITESVNEAPTADAGDDISGTLNTSVTLDGSNSSDPDGDALSYQWTLSSNPVGAQISISGADQAQASFVPDVAGTYNFRLKVTDPFDASDTDNVSVTVE